MSPNLFSSLSRYSLPVTGGVCRQLWGSELLCSPTSSRTWVCVSTYRPRRTVSVTRPWVFLSSDWNKNKVEELKTITEVTFLDKPSVSRSFGGCCHHFRLLHLHPSPRLFFLFFYLPTDGVSISCRSYLQMRRRGVFHHKIIFQTFLGGDLITSTTKESLL